MKFGKFWDLWKNITSCAIINEGGCSFVEIVKSDAILNLLAGRRIRTAWKISYFSVFLKSVIEDVEDLWRLIFDRWHDVKMTSIIKRESLQSWPRILHYVLVIHNAVSLYKYFTLSSKFCNHYFCIQIAWCFLERIYKRKSIWNWKYGIKYFHLNVFE